MFEFSTKSIFRVWFVRISYYYLVSNIIFVFFINLGEIRDKKVLKYKSNPKKKIINYLLFEIKLYISFFKNNKKLQNVIFSI